MSWIAIKTLAKSLELRMTSDPMKEKKKKMRMRINRLPNQKKLKKKKVNLKSLNFPWTIRKLHQKKETS